MPTGPEPVGRAEPRARCATIDRVRTRRITGSALGVLTTAGVVAAGGLAAGAEAGSVSRPDSGIHGHVIVGPTCPVQRPGRICSRPYAARITIRREPAGTLAVRLRSASDGDFT